MRSNASVTDDVVKSTLALLEALRNSVRTSWSLARYRACTRWKVDFTLIVSYSDPLSFSTHVLLLARMVPTGMSILHPEHPHGVRPADGQDNRIAVLAWENFGMTVVSRSLNPCTSPVSGSLC